MPCHFLKHEKADIGQFLQLCSFVSMTGKPSTTSVNKQKMSPLPNGCIPPFLLSTLLFLPQMLILNLHYSGNYTNQGNSETQTEARKYSRSPVCGRPAQSPVPHSMVFLFLQVYFSSMIRKLGIYVTIHK